ncbi:MAG: glycosyltransferase family 2 protein [Chloroflexi bacterium]|nr:glycosyltransferase family 2 protein [Chloroflexota bacterium]
MKVTIAIPAYDEVGSLASVVDEARAVLSGDGEVLIVDDGSRDGTAALADTLAASHPKVRVVHHETNRGFSGAMETCFRRSRGDWIFLVPADGQTHVDELARFLTRAADADIVVGVRSHRADRWERKVLSRGFHLVARTLYDLPLREFSSAFLFRRSLLDEMPFRSRPRSATLLPEILFRARRRGARIVELDVPQFPRRAGRAKGGQLSVALITLVELLRLWPLIRLDEARKVKRVATAP